MELYAIFGAGGFGREVMPVAHTMLNYAKSSINCTQNHELIFVVENLEKKTIINGYRNISEEDFLACKTDKRYFNIAIADYKTRERIADKMINAGISPFSIVDSSSIMLDGNTLGEGAILCPFTTITSNAKIGRFFHANIYSYVAHDCVIGNFVTFAPSVHCNGRVIIDDYAYIGTGAMIKQGTDKKPIIIGKGAVVGMGAVVTKTVKPFTTVIGNPAFEIRKTT